MLGAEEAPFKVSGTGYDTVYTVLASADGHREVHLKRKIVKGANGKDRGDTLLK